MLYKFKSKVSGDVIMLQTHGEQVLSIIGKHQPNAPRPQGILLPHEMPAARAALEAAIVQEQAQRQQALDEARAEGRPPPRFDAVTLRQRAHPFLLMMAECAAADVPIVWGV